MQWQTMVKFSGQVKQAGIERTTAWKSGFVDFDYDSVSGAWLVKLYLQVNPNRVYQQMKIGQSDDLRVKCGRLMIENKRGDGIHIKLSSNDVQGAKCLVSKIQSSVLDIPKQNKAEVGVTQNTSLSRSKGSENVSPIMNNNSVKDVTSRPILEGCQVNSEKWLSKKTPPYRQKEVNPNPPSKRRLTLPSPERQRNGGMCKEEEPEDDMLLTSNHFTSMKDYSKRGYQGGNGLTCELGAKTFYGAQNTLINDTNYRGLSRGNHTIGNSKLYSSGNVEGSPSLKKPRLSLAVGSKTNRIVSPAAGSRKMEPSSNASHIVGSRDDQPNRQWDGTTVGFENLGNTCFMNSPLQCLSSLEPFSLDIQSAVAQYGSKLRPNSITRMLYLLMKDVRKLDVNLHRVTEILVRLRRDIDGKFAPNTQQDAHELLNELLDRIDREVKLVAGERTGEEGATALFDTTPYLTPTEVNFNWFYNTSFYFHECKRDVLAKKEEEEIILLLAIDSNTMNIQDCIDKYFESTVLDVMCEHCGKMEKATVTRKIIKRPRIFILNLMRYQTDNLTSKKKQDTVDIPRYISLAEYCADDVKAPPAIEPVFMLDRIETDRLKFLEDVSPETPVAIVRPQQLVNKDTAPQIKVKNGQEMARSWPLERVRPSQYKQLHINIADGTCDEPLDILRYTPDSPQLSYNNLDNVTLASGHSSNQFGEDDQFSLTSHDPNNNSARDLDKRPSPVDFDPSVYSNLEIGADCLNDFDLETDSPFQSALCSFDRPSTSARPSEDKDKAWQTAVDLSFPILPEMDCPQMYGEEVEITSSTSPPKIEKQGTKEEANTEEADPELPLISETHSTSEETESGGSREFGHMTSRSTVTKLESKVICEPINEDEKTKKRHLFVTEGHTTVTMCRTMLDGMFEELHSYLELAEREGDNIGEAHSLAEALLLEAKAYAESVVNMAAIPTSDPNIEKLYQEEVETRLCVNLLQRAIKCCLDGRNENISPAASLQDTDLVLMAAEMMADRYYYKEQVSQRKTLFIQDLGLLLAGEQLHILKQPADFSTRIQANVKKEEMAQNTMGQSGLDMASQAESSDDEVILKKGCAREGLRRKKVTFGKDCTQTLEMDGETIEGSKKIMTNRVSGSRPILGKNWGQQDDHFDTDYWDHSNTDAKFTNSGRSVRDDSTSNELALAEEHWSKEMLLGREVNSYTKEELTNLDSNALTFDEMMVCAQALSRLEYIREERAKMQVAKDEVDGEISMELCNSSDTPEGAVDFPALPSTSKDINKGEVVPCSEHGESVCATTESRLVLENSSIATLTQNSAASKSAKPKSDNEANLHCDEELSDFDDVSTVEYGTQTDSPMFSGNGKDCPPNPVFESQPITDIEDFIPEERCLACGNLHYGECTFCLDQADFASQPLDTNFSIPEDNLPFCDKPKGSDSHILSPSRSVANKCNTLSNLDVSSKMSAKPDEKMNRSESLFPVPTEEKASRCGTESDGDHVVPGSSSFTSPRKESFLCSPSKPNNLVKTRDYARLRSPSASPKKRTSRTQQTKPSTATKRFQFPEGEKCARSSAPVVEEGQSSRKTKDMFSLNDSNSISGSDSDLVSCMSMEVNVDDTSFLGHIDSCSSTSSVRAATPPSTGGGSRSISIFSPAVKNSSTPVASHSPSSKSTGKGVFEDLSSSPLSRNTSCDHVRVLEEPSGHQRSFQSKQSTSDKLGDHTEQGFSPSKARKISFSQNLPENTKPDKSFSAMKSKTSRSLNESFGSVEEKENKPENLARLRRLDNIETGQADLSYRLVGVVNHIGDSLNAGHYTAFSYNLSKQLWYYMNDTNTKETTESEAQEESMNSGYVFFYMDKDLFNQYQAKVRESSMQK